MSALGLLVLWAASGSLLGFSDTWQLIISTSTTIITFLTGLLSKTRKIEITLHWQLILRLSW
jgi:low affinity Fe/Cu permease